MSTMTIQQMIQGRQVHTIGPECTVRSACIVMTSLNVGALPVVDENDTLLGILSERDVIKRSVIVYRPSDSTRVSQVMTRNPKWLPPDAAPAEALHVMARGGFRHLPVCRQGRIVGILSIRDFTPTREPALKLLWGKTGKMLISRFESVRTHVE